MDSSSRQTLASMELGLSKKPGEWLGLREEPNSNEKKINI
jgi:hypothetical protein